MDLVALVALIKARRPKLGWNQTELAAAMGSSPSRVNKMESADGSVAASLMLRALDGMATPLPIESSCDPFTDPALTRKQRRCLSTRLLRRAQAQVITQDLDLGFRSMGEPAGRRQSPDDATEAVARPKYSDV